MNLLIVAQELKLAILRKHPLYLVLHSNHVLLQLEHQLVLVAASAAFQGKRANHVLDGIIKIAQIDTLLNHVEHGVDFLVRPEQSLVRIGLALDVWIDNAFLV